MRWIDLPETWDGAYHHPTRTIYLRSGMPDWQAVPTLMHELTHHALGHDGHQSDSVESRINRSVARALVTVADLERAEREVGPHAGAQAAELDVPTWVIHSLRRDLAHHRAA